MSTSSDAHTTAPQPGNDQPKTRSVASPYLTTTEAAEYLRTTVQGVYSLVKRGRLHSMPGRRGRLLFTREQLDRCVSTRWR